MRVVTFGEIMMRLSTPGHQRFLQAQQFDVTFGGSEANVAVALAQYGLESCFVTKLPDNELGQACLNRLRSFGVDTSAVVRGGDRLGLYFVETGASQRSSKVVYDRARSAVTTLEAGALSFDEIFDGVDWFHWSGITPALGAQPRRALEQACRAAHAAGLTVSCDLNYRSKLWSEEEAQCVMVPLMDYVDVCIAGRGDAFAVLGLEHPSVGSRVDGVDVTFYEQTAFTLKEQFGFDTVAITLRHSLSASLHEYSALMIDERDCIEPQRSRCYDIQLVDRIGGGDAFSGGLIYGLLTKADTHAALEFAVAASCLQQTIPGDFNLVTVDEVEKLVQGGGWAQVER